MPFAPLVVVLAQAVLETVPALMLVCVIYSGEYQRTRPSAVQGRPWSMVRE